MSYKQHLEKITSRFDEALSEHGYDAVVISAGSQHMIFLDDMPYPFKVNPHFKSFVPLTDAPDSFIVYEPGSKPKVLLHQPVDYWHKQPETPTDEWVEHVELQSVRSREEAVSSFPRNGGKVAWLGEPMEKVSDESFEVNPRELIAWLDYERAWKTDYEIECMRKANARAVRGHIAARDAFHAGASEWEIHLEYLRATDQNESQLPYGNIIALNENAAVLHYQYQSRWKPNGERRSFLIDAGASWNGYASDITRTYSAADDEFAELVRSMEREQLELVEEVRPGADYPGLHMSAHRRVGKLLNEHGLVDMDPEEMVETDVTKKFFPHGVGHYIGLQVHDVGGFSRNRDGETIEKPEGHPWLRLTRELDVSHVLTIEPGLYFIESLLEELRSSEHASRVDWKRVDALRPFGGVRIEDDVVVTETGHENLTRDQFKAVGE